MALKGWSTLFLLWCSVWSDWLRQSTIERATLFRHMRSITQKSPNLKFQLIKRGYSSWSLNYCKWSTRSILSWLCALICKRCKPSTIWQMCLIWKILLTSLWPLRSRFLKRIFRNLSPRFKRSTVLQRLCTGWLVSDLKTSIHFAPHVSATMEPFWRRICKRKRSVSRPTYSTALSRKQARK